MKMMKLKDVPRSATTKMMPNHLEMYLSNAFNAEIFTIVNSSAQRHEAQTMCLEKLTDIGLPVTPSA